jgi:single-stranded-DNA-specific exonuclease
MREVGVDPHRVTAGRVGFGLAPRLNALGRVGEAGDGLRLLLTDDVEEAARLARLAERMNRQRQDEDQRTLREALELLSTSFEPEAHYGVVLESEGWHPGVVGIVASRVAERVHRPTVLIALDGQRGRGSARSVPQFDILEGIRACGSHLERFGGHRQAAGIEIHRDRLQGFRDAFHQEARRALAGTDLRPTVSVDVEASLEEMTPELLGYLAYMGPHGIGNPGPLFLARRVTLSRDPGVVGSGHLKLRLRREGEELEAIGFGLANRLPPQELGRGPLDLVFQLKDNEFRGVRKLQARLRDIRPSPGEDPGVAGAP